MPSTKRSMNWSSVGWTPSGGSLTTITGVTNVNFDDRGNLVEFSGDGDRFPTTIVNDMSMPQAVVTAADVAAIRTSPPGTVGTLVATLRDAKNGVTASGGAVIYTLINAVVQNNPVTGRHRQFAEATLTVRAYSSDGTTNPLSAAAV